MKDRLIELITLSAIMYGVCFIFAAIIGATARIDSPANCKVVVADYVFLGATRLACEIK